MLSGVQDCHPWRVPLIPDWDIYPMRYQNLESQKNGKASGEQEQIPGQILTPSAQGFVSSEITGLPPCEITASFRRQQER